jgi:hypothetical protein
MGNPNQIQSFADLASLTGVATLRSRSWTLQRAVELVPDPEGETVGMSSGVAVPGRWLTGPHRGQHVLLRSNGQVLGCSVDLDGEGIDCSLTAFVGDRCDRVRAYR